jgi:hypothetical protein
LNDEHSNYISAILEIYMSQDNKGQPQQGGQAISQGSKVSSSQGRSPGSKVSTPAARSRGSRRSSPAKSLVRARVKADFEGTPPSEVAGFLCSQ